MDLPTLERNILFVSEVLAEYLYGAQVLSLGIGLGEVGVGCG